MMEQVFKGGKQFLVCPQSYKLYFQISRNQPNWATRSMGKQLFLCALSWIMVVQESARDCMITVGSGEADQ